MASRQFLGSNGTSREPNVNTAASSSAKSAAPIPKVQRCFGSSELIGKPASPAAERDAADIHCNEDCGCGNTPCRCEQSGRGIHYTAAHLQGGYVRIIGGFARSDRSRRPVDAAPAFAGYRRRPQKRDAVLRTAGWSPRSPARSRGPPEVSRAGRLLGCGTSWSGNRCIQSEENEQSISVSLLSGESSPMSE